MGFRPFHFMMLFMKTSLKTRVSLYFLFVLAQTIFYEGIGALNTSFYGTQNFYEPATFLDQLMPFIPETVWTYSLYYLILGFGFILAYDRSVFDFFVRDLIVVSAIADLSFVLVPVMITTPTILPGQHDLLTEWLFGKLIPLDVRGNCFPSLHCAHSMVISLWLWRSDMFKGWVAKLFTLATILVIISTLTLKKHWFVDVLGAFVLVAVVSKTWSRQNVSHRRWFQRRY